jgi:putative transposase
MQHPEVYVYRRNLPHWRLAGATYFVTWRLGSGQVELSAEERSLIVDCLHHFDRKRYDLLAYVVMNDHVHALVTPTGNWKLEQLVHGWKSFSTHQLQHAHGRIGQVWQGEYFDRVVRDEAELLEKATYIAHNPWKRWPDLLGYPWLGLRD